MQRTKLGRRTKGDRDRVELAASPCMVRYAAEGAMSYPTADVTGMTLMTETVAIDRLPCLMASRTAKLFKRKPGATISRPGCHQL